MNLCVRDYRWLCLLTCIVIICYGRPVVAQVMPEKILDADNIAKSSLSVAEAMKSTGYCYAGVSKALSPLGVSLTGNAAYQARDLLLADSRFSPISFDESADLQRGDILVFNKSSSRPYGHISVYQGNNQETSDHVSRLTSPEAYGGVTVFRLNSETTRIASSSEPFEWTYRMPVSAPDFRRPIQSGVPAEWRKPKKFNEGLGDTKTGGILKRTVRLMERELSPSTSASVRRAIKSKLINFVMQNL